MSSSRAISSRCEDTILRVRLALRLLPLVLALLPGLLAGQVPQPRGVEVLAVPQDVRVEEGFDATHSAGLFVGVSDFEDADFTEVPYAADDAVDLAYLFAVELRLIAPRKIALSLAGAPQKSISRDRLRALRDAGASIHPATYSEILRLLDKQKQESRPQGLFVVAFATHGFSNEGDDFLLASDSLRHRLTSTGLAVGRIFDSVAQARSPRRLLLLDACRERLSPSRALTDRHGAMSPSFVDAIAGARGQVVLSGTTLGGYSYDDPDRGNGVFTAALLDGLQGQAPTDERSFITVRLLADFVDRQVVQWVRRNRREHTEISRGISVQLEAAAVAEMPLAVVTPGQAKQNIPKPFPNLPPGEVDLTGEWRGLYHLYPHALGMTLTVQRSYENDRQRLEGRLELYPLEHRRRGGTSQPSGSYEVTIDYVPGSQSLRIKLGRWLGPLPQKARMANMIAVYSRSDDTIAGVLDKWDEDNSPFFVLKRAEAAALIQSALEAMHTRDTRYVWWARVAPSKQRVDQWSDRLFEEYPGIENGLIGPIHREGRRLFRDSHFKRYLRVAYDQLGRAGRAAIRSKLEEENPQDPNASAKRWSLATRFGNFHHTDTMVSVLGMRSLERWYEEMQYRLEHLEPGPNALQIIDGIESQVKRLPQAFWPSEIAAIESRARQIRSEITLLAEPGRKP